MEAKRVVRMKNGKYAIQDGYEEFMDFGEGKLGRVVWDFEMFRDSSDKSHRLLFNTEHDADQHIQKWINENQISEICMEVYINEEK